MTKFRPVTNMDLYSGNTLYNRNGTPRLLSLSYNKFTFNHSGAWYTKEELLNRENGWKVECHEDELLKVLMEASDLGMISGFRRLKSSYGTLYDIEVESCEKLEIEIKDYLHSIPAIRSSSTYIRSNLSIYSDRIVLLLNDLIIHEYMFGDMVKVISRAIMEYKSLEELRGYAYDAFEPII